MVPDDFPEQSHRNLKSLKCNDRQSIHSCAEKLLRDMSTEIIVKEYQGATPQDTLHSSFGNRTWH